MTSLQQQLLSIRAQSTQELNLKAQKIAHSKSLVFSQADAASQSFFDIYQYCIRGFKELCRLDARFAPFAGNIFSEQSMDVERTQMSRDENAKLDTTLESFLGLVGPRLQLRDAQCALEWLVRRFRVHEYNTQFFILTFLPYHDTNMFTIVLQLIPDRRLPPVLEFMRPYISTRTNFRRPVLVREASRRSALLNAISQYVLKVSREDQHGENLIGFWVDVSVQSLNGLLDKARSGRENVQNSRQDEVLLEITSVLHDALQLRSAPELTLACYSLIMLVVSKTALDDQWVDSLLVATGSTLDASNFEACLTCLAVLAEERSSKRNKLPKALASQLKRQHASLLEALRAVESKTSVNRLTYGLCLAMLENYTQQDPLECLQVVVGAVQYDLLSKSKTKAIMSHTIQSTTTARSGNMEDSERATLLVDILRSWAKSTEHSATFRKAVQASGVLDSQLPSAVLVEVGGSEKQTEPKAVVLDAMDVDDSSADPPLQLDSIAHTEESFFQEIAPASFEPLRSALATVASRNETGLDILAIKPFSRMSKRALDTFFIRTWCSPASPFIARQAALKTTAQRLSTNSKIHFHPQMLIPFLLCALGDVDRRVRQGAVDVILLIQANLEADLEPRASSKGDDLGLEVSLLSAADAKAFLKALSPYLEACVLDNSQAKFTVNGLLAGHSDHLQQQGQKEIKDLKSTVRASLELFLAGCAVRSRLLTVQLRVLPMLSRSGKAATAARLQYVYPLLRSWAQQSRTIAQDLATTEGHKLHEVSEKLFSLLSAKEHESEKLLRELLDDQSKEHRQDLEDVVFSELTRLYRKTEVSAELTQRLISIALPKSADNVSSSRRAAARETFKSVHVSAPMLSSLLSIKTESENHTSAPSPSKRRRTSKTGAGRPPLGQADFDHELEHHTLILEKIEESKEKSPELLRGLFNTLSYLLRLENTTQTRLDYLIHLVIRSLNTIVEHLVTADAPHENKEYQSSMRMDTLVECLRNTSGRGSQNDILLLISKLATWNPELVLHSVMPIFTFMGNNTVRHGDDYTIHVISRTIETVIPPLATSLRKKNRNVITSLSEVLQSFAAAYEHTPSHRRLPLFQLLVQKLGPEDSLFGVIGMLVDRQSNDASTVNFLGDLMATFDAHVELHTLKRCFDLLLDAQAPNAFAPRRTFSEAILNTKEKTSEQIDSTAAELLSVISDLLRRPNFRRRVAKICKAALAADEKQAASSKTEYSQLLAQSINLYHVFSRKQSAYQLDAKKALLNVMKVLPVSEMLRSVSGVLDSASEDVQIVALRALEDQIQTVVQSDTAAVDALLQFVTNLSDNLKTTQEIELKQVTMSCIDQIAERFGKRETTAIYVAAETIAGEAALGHLDISLQTLALLTLASMVDILHEDFVPLIPRIFQQAYSILEISAGQERFDELRSALFAITNALTEHLPQMLSEADLDRTLKLCHSSAAGIPVQDAGTGRQECYALVARYLSADASFAAAQRNLEHSINTGPEACFEQLGFVLSLVQRQSKRAVREHGTTIFNIVTRSWDIRRLRQENQVFEKLYSDDDVDTVQDLTNDIAMAAINKLNDDSLRPHFITLIDWASKFESKAGLASWVSNVTCLFSLLKVINDRLKSLVTSYATYYLKMATEVLTKVQPTTTPNIDVLEVVLAALSSNFDSDESDYWQDPQHFDTVASALLQQILHFAQAGHASLASHVLPAINNFVSAAYSTDKRTYVNTEVLKLLRHDDARVRFAAVQCQREMLVQVGDEWVTMVSQMLPFINEAQEDDDERVEKETRKWIAELEAGLGESMAGMLQ